MHRVVHSVPAAVCNHPAGWPPGRTRMPAGLLEEIRPVCEQFEPERVRSCRNAITMASVMIDEIRLRAHARPLDEPEP